MKPLTGTVVSTKMDKTAVVEVVRSRFHPVYKKRTKAKKKYPAHDGVGVKVGDKVRIQDCRPISKTKKWKVIKVVGKDKGVKIIEKVKTNKKNKKDKKTKSKASS